MTGSDPTAHDGAVQDLHTVDLTTIDLTTRGATVTLEAPPPRILLSPPVVGPMERAYVLDALDSGWVAPAGPHLDAFERELAAAAGTSHAVALSSGTAALQLALALSGVVPGDEVIVPTLTFIGSAAPVVHLGATPVFMDVDPMSWTLDPDLLEHDLEQRAAKGRLPRAVVVVDLYGQTADYDAITSICSRHGVRVVEDAAEALGATNRGRLAGSLAPLAAFSFNGNKTITTSGGGALLTDDPELARRALELGTPSRLPVAHYEHATVGMNYRLSNVLAALGRAQLTSLPARLEHRRWLHQSYRARLDGVPGLAFMPEAAWGRSSRWLTVITIDATRFGATREDVRLHLQRERIETRPVFKPLHRQPAFRPAVAVGGRVADHLFGTGLCLPSGFELGAAELDRVVTAIMSVPRH